MKITVNQKQDERLLDLYKRYNYSSLIRLYENGYSNVKEEYFDDIFDILCDNDIEFIYEAKEYR